MGGILAEKAVCHVLTVYVHNVWLLTFPDIFHFWYCGTSVGDNLMLDRKYQTCLIVKIRTGEALSWSEAVKWSDRRYTLEEYLDK